MDWLNIAMLVIVPASSIWVYFDAVAHGVGCSGEPLPYPFGWMWNRSPGGWAVLSLLFWIPFFGIYVALRPQLKGRAETAAPRRGWLFGAWLVASVAFFGFAFSLASRAPACDDNELIREVAKAANAARLEPVSASGSSRSRSCGYLARGKGGERAMVTAEVKSTFGGYAFELESLPEMPVCTDDDYLRDVQDMLKSSGLTQLRVTGEVSST